MLPNILKITGLYIFYQGLIRSIAMACTTSSECLNTFHSTLKILSFCCGECGRGYCCGNRTLEMKSSGCYPVSGENDINSSSKMLGAIIGGMVVAFLAAMMGHAVVRKLLKRRKRRNRDGENGMPISHNRTEGESPRSDADVAFQLPTYDQIHLYKRVENVDGLGFETGTRSKQKNDKFRREDDLDSLSTPPPPPYSISARISESRSDGVNTTSLTTHQQQVTVDENPLSSVHPANDPSTNVQAGTSVSAENSETIVVQVMDLIKTLESTDNTNSRNALQSVKKYLSTSTEQAGSS